MGLDVLGYLIEIVSGKKLDKFFREEIFEPLEMNDTYFYLPSRLDNVLRVKYDKCFGGANQFKLLICLFFNKFS